MYSSAMSGMIVVALSLVVFSIMFECSSAMSTGTLSKRLRMKMASGTPVLPLDGRYFLGDSFIEDHHWLVMFCGGQDAQKCENVRQEMVGVVKNHGAPMDDMHFGEVDCTRDEAFCNSQKFESSPVVAVHYFKGMRQTIWLPTEHSQGSAAAEFITWFRASFVDDDTWSLLSLWDNLSQWLPSVETVRNRVSQYLPSIDPEYTVDFVCIVIFQIAVVSWVLMYGFELKMPYRTWLHCPLLSSYRR
mmetsp:Transcript_16475/g.26140  ORF Transcript_16475/g.26140 Transcript_16475/m.26140 type:complete len:245 (-) Transcript_16475:118-852(-)